MPVNWKGIQTTRDRYYDADAIAALNDSLQSFPAKQRASILGTFIEESGGDPLARSENGTYQGYAQWGPDRYRIQSNDRKVESHNQLEYFRNTIDNTTDGKSWTHGGTGSGYNSLHETHDTFYNPDASFDDVYRAFSYGYVRPKGKEDSYRNRLKVAKQVYNRVLADDVLKNSAAAVRQIGEMMYPNEKSSGGSLHSTKSWDGLSMKEKANVMKLAVESGIYDLDTIKQEYNKFAEGGDENINNKPKFRQSQEAYYDKETDTVYAPDSTGEFYYHEMFHARPDTALLNRLKPFYENLNDIRLKELGADLPFVKRIENDPGHFYSPEEVGARVSAARYMLNNAGVSNIDNVFLEKARKNENAYGDNFRDLLHMYNNENLVGIFGNGYSSGGKIYIKPENRGKFTALKERTGHSATWFKEHGTPAQKKMATFALNSRKWKHGLGGNLYPVGGLMGTLPSNAVPTIVNNLQKAKNKATEHIRQRLYDNVIPFGYNNIGERVASAVILNEPSSKQEMPEGGNYDALDELWATYLNIPQDKRHYDPILKVSKYKPTKSKDANATYYSIPFSDDEKQEIIDSSYAKELKPLYYRASSGMSPELGKYIIDKGRDSKGDYASYYDVWDLNPFRGITNIGNEATDFLGLDKIGDMSLGIGKPIEIYDRIYLDDYYNVPNKDRGGHYLPEVIVTGKKKEYGGLLDLANAAIERDRRNIKK